MWNVGVSSHTEYKAPLSENQGCKASTISCVIGRIKGNQNIPGG
jgi:hypothetical protein